MTTAAARNYLELRYGIQVTSRTVREWIKRGLLHGRRVDTLLGSYYCTWFAFIDLAVQAGSIPPRRGNPAWRADPEKTQEDDHDS